MLFSINTLLRFVALAAVSSTVASSRVPNSKHGLVLEKRTTKAPSQASYYSTLIAFGASYTGAVVQHNAHSRADQYASSIRNYFPYTLGGGRYSNGPVAVEYMAMSNTTPPLNANKATIKLIDYAYGGAEIDNSLVSGSVPASKDQISQYLSDLKSGAISIGSRKVLHYINTGINPVTAIWLDTIWGGFTPDLIANATRRVSANIAAVATQVRSINTNGVVYSTCHGADYLIVGIPPLEIVPSLIYQASNNATELALLKKLTAQYNAGISAFAATFKKEARNGNVFYYDLAALWYSFHSTPKTYGFTISPITTTCYNSSANTVCSKPTSYLYFDSLHPVTSAHLKIAQKLNSLVRSG
ncbi:hypothetical protein T439DRAFT_383462 [Meredithblackwellia eburnea MCA 4105]